MICCFEDYLQHACPGEPTSSVFASLPVPQLLDQQIAAQRVLAGCASRA
ncbi:hypothetical protein [Methylobacter sp. YRD-M1]|nr:hypothetical protein [Methylobacter sp. YRD-M1]WAK03210.1 hypothetical protein LZ558_05340 [Methylobacter sp. YRD-M1]